MTVRFLLACLQGRAMLATIIMVGKYFGELASQQ
jgi:hypothetical protein